MTRKRESRRSGPKQSQPELPRVASYYVEEDGSVPAREALLADERRERFGSRSSLASLLSATTRRLPSPPAALSGR